MGTVPGRHSPSGRVYRLESKTNTMSKDSLTEQKMTGESLLPKHVELLTPYSAHRKPKVRPNHRLLLGVVGVTFIIGWLSILTIATFNGRQGKESFAQKILSGKEVERLVESMVKGNDTEQQRDRRQITYPDGTPVDPETEAEIDRIAMVVAESLVTWSRGSVENWRRERGRELEEQARRSTTTSSLPRCSDRGDSMSMYCRED